MSESANVSDSASFLRRLWWSMETFFIRVRRRLPYIVWYGDELDVRVTLTNEKLFDNSGGFWDCESILSKMDIHFDAGIGGGGRDWEWDYSLRGPISVKFRGRAKSPELRLARPKPRLVFSKPPTDQAARGEEG